MTSKWTAVPAAVATALSMALAVAPSGAGVAAATGPPSAAGAVSASEQAFALDLLHRLGPASPNLVLSPSSIATLLAMLEPGAVGPTQAGISAALHSVSLSAGQQAQGWHVLNAALAGRARRDHVAFDTADQIWLQSGFPVRPSYLALLSSDFAVGVQESDLQDDPGGAAEAIDHWVAARTDGHIAHLLQPADLQDVVAVLVDAVYLDAPWASAFDPALTAPGPFHVSVTTTVDVHMMSGASPLDLAVSTGPALEAAELPYQGGHLSALVVMPPLGRLASFESQLTPSRLAGVVAGLDRQRADVKLPRFSLNTAMRLNQVLSAMGMAQAFSRNADFSSISPRSLTLGFVVHDAQIEVTEKGTEASGATGGGLAPTAMPAPPPVQIVFDHPFLFLVRDNTTGAVLFEAQVTEP